MKQVMIMLMVLNMNVCVYAMDEYSDEEYLEKPITVSSMVQVICDQKNLLEQERSKLLSQEAVIQNFINIVREKEETIEVLTMANAQHMLDTEAQDRKITSLKNRLKAAHACISRVIQTLEQEGDDKSQAIEQMQREVVQFWETRINSFSRSSRSASSPATRDLDFTA